jgi:hypothetical protein
MKRIKDLIKAYAVAPIEVDHDDLIDGNLTVWYSTDGTHAEQRLLKHDNEPLAEGDLYYGFMPIEGTQVAVMNFHYLHNLRTNRISPALRQWPQGFRAILSGTAYVTPKE